MVCNLEMMKIFQSNNLEVVLLVSKTKWHKKHKIIHVECLDTLSEGFHSSWVIELKHTSQSVIPRLVSSSSSPGNLLTCKFSGPTSELLNQILSGDTQGSVLFLGDSDAH